MGSMSALMEYLCKLVKSPDNCVILDPFMGSGSTGVACINQDIQFVGIEREKEYYGVAKNRLIEASEQAEQIEQNQLCDIVNL